MHYKIKKAKLNGRALTVDMEELETTNDVTVTHFVTKKCAHLAHEDLLNAFKNLIPHLVAICDFRGSELVTVDSIQDPEELIHKFTEFKLGSYEITGISEGGNDDSQGVTIIAQRSFDSGKVLNIVTPFTQYFSDDYKHGYELSEAIQRCLYEVEQYLFEHKFAEKQLEMDFGGMDEMDIKAEAEAVMDLIEKSNSKKKKRAETEAA